ncbi:MAG: SGNH/GDSL hydrolase family protein [Actinomycetota bacterium]|nr:SGNH/GDSL hydrolase family protein [Actinomycetota bacterium]
MTGRPSSRFVRTAAALSRGVAAVQRQHPAYAGAWHAANLEALTRPGPRWIVFGDSMSQGVGATGFDAGWVNQVHRRLGLSELELPIINLSASGARVPDLLRQQLPAWRNLPCAPAAAGSVPPSAEGSVPPARTGPDLITVLIGSNDLMSRTHRAGLATAFAQLLRQLPDGAVIATMPQPRGAAEDVNALLLKAAARATVTIADLRSSGPPSWRGRLAADHFHPNDLGYAGIADAFYEPVRQALARRGLATTAPPDR